MKLYTRGGDKGLTSLIGGRVLKTNAKVEAYGTIDELNSFVGLAAAKADSMNETARIAEQLAHIMHELFDAGSDLAYAQAGHPFKLTEESIARLEEWIDEHTTASPELTKFILPGALSCLPCCIFVVPYVAVLREKRWRLHSSRKI